MYLYLIINIIVIYFDYNIVENNEIQFSVYFILFNK